MKTFNEILHEVMDQNKGRDVWGLTKEQFNALSVHWLEDPAGSIPGHARIMMLADPTNELRIYGHRFVFIKDPEELNECLLQHF